MDSLVTQEDLPKLDALRTSKHLSLLRIFQNVVIQTFAEFKTL